MKKTPSCAALYFPDFVAQAHIFKYPQYQKQAFVILPSGQSHRRQVILSAAPLCRAMYPSIYKGMPWNVIQKKYPRLHSYEYDPDAIQMAKEYLLAISENTTPDYFFEANCLQLNLEGTQKIYQNSITCWWQKISPSLASFTYRTALATSPLIARLLAHSGILGNWVYCQVEQEQNAVARIPLIYVHELSAKSQKTLASYSILTIEDLHTQKPWFYEQFFPKEAHFIQKLCSLLQGAPIPHHNTLRTKNTQASKPYSIHITHSLESNDIHYIHSQIRKFADELAWSLRQQKLQSALFYLIIEYADAFTQSVQHNLPQSVQDFLTIAGVYKHLIQQAYQRRISLKQVTLKASRCTQQQLQLDLFLQPQQQAYQNLQDSIDRIRQKNGFSAIESGGICLTGKKGQKN
jgi:hypothetical protein